MRHKRTLALLLVGSVLVPGCAGPLKQPTPAHLEYGRLSFTPEDTEVGGEIEASIALSNSGDSHDSTTVVLMLDGKTRLTQYVTLAGHEATAVTFPLTSANLGLHTVLVEGGPSGEYAVRKIERPATGTRLLDKTSSLPPTIDPPPRRERVGTTFKEKAPVLGAPIL